ncbi:MAG: GDP-L-fucose synthase [Candidatus Roizmanbacteria bacterium]|nr:MAG: GDP-L-fucose synthase [Candidatus Roizmanbacteria bacterium]
MDKKSKTYIVGHNGLIGSAILRKYIGEGYGNLLTKTRQELDLTNQCKVEELFKKEKPDYVILSAARVGGIKANMTYPAEFIYENLMIQNNVIWSAFKYKIKKLMYIACGCAYPTNSTQPMREEYLLTGPPEPTNEGFAIAKIAGLKLCEKIYTEYGMKFVSCIPTNTYGENDHFDELRSHAIPALLKKIHNAKKSNSPAITLFGTGKAEREFIYVDDIAEAVFLLMNVYEKNEVINIGSGEALRIKELAQIIRKVVGYSGKILYDTSKPDGMLKRTLDSSKIKQLGFSCRVPLLEGIERTYNYFLRI